MSRFNHCYSGIVIARSGSSFMRTLEDIRVVFLSPRSLVFLVVLHVAQSLVYTREFMFYLNLRRGPRPFSVPVGRSIKFRDCLLRVSFYAFSRWLCRNA